MKKQNKKIQIGQVKKTLNKVKMVERVVSDVEYVRKVVSDTIYVRNDIAVDLKNFSTMSVIDPSKF